MAKRKRKVLHVVPRKAGGWEIKGVPPLKLDAHFTYQTKKLAVGVALRWARENKPSQVVVHNRNGKIAFERTYGQDPQRYPS